MKKIEVSEFKEQCLELLDHLDEDGLIITQGGVPVARVVPLHGSSADHSGVRGAELIGSLRGKLKIRGDVFTTGCRWDADSEV